MTERQPGSIRLFPTSVVASVTSGTLLADFASGHECYEWLVGDRVWTHQIPRISPAVSALVVALHPLLPTDEIAGCTRDNWRDHVSQLVAVHGPAIALPRGDGSLAMPPLQGLPTP